MRVNVLLLSSLLPVAFAYSNTHPVIAWASHHNPSLQAAPSSDILENILLSDDACNHDAIVLVDQPGLYASDLRVLSPYSSLSSSINSAPSSIQLPYVPMKRENPFPDFAEVISRKCGSKIVHTTPGGLSGSVEQNGGKHVVCMNMPPLSEHKGSDRKNLLSEHESQLSADFEALSFIFPNHLVVYAGRPYTHSLYSRQDHPESAPHNGTALPEGGILKRYQLLTPGLILSLLVAFFVLVPIILGGINALASIKNPIRVDNAKFNAAEKKNQ